MAAADHNFLPPVFEAAPPSFHDVLHIGREDIDQEASACLLRSARRIPRIELLESCIYPAVIIDKLLCLTQSIAPAGLVLFQGVSNNGGSEKQYTRFVPD